MESIAVPLRRLQEEGAWFARASEIKLLYVRTDATMRGAAVEMLMSLEHHADNRALFFRFDDPFADRDRGWPARVQRLEDQLAEKIEALAPAGIELRPLAPASGALAGAAAFGASLLRLPASLAQPLTGPLVVLAPTRVQDEAVFRDEVAALVTAPQLGHVRWIVVEADGVALLPLVERLGPASLGCVCTVDEKQQQDDLAAAGAASVSDPVASAPRTVGWRSPGAMPDVEAPPRVGAVALPSDDALRAEGLSPAFIKGGGETLKRLVLGGALALRQGRHADAIALQARAAALCAEMEMPREQILNAHVVAGYLIAAGQRTRAREVYSKAGELATAGDFADLGAQTALALGVLDAVERRPAEAAAHYSAAGRLAERAKIEALAIECWRMAGQLALDARLESSAVECWKRALALAEPLDPDVAKLTGAAEVARALAALCRRRGLVAQAESLERRSVALESGTAASSSADSPKAAAS
jgi:tetratricopeptide (TPR) repeat protein